MKLGVDAFPLTKELTGVGNYIFYLLDELIRLRSDVQFFLYAPSQTEALCHFSRYPNVTLRLYPAFSFSHLLWKETTLAYLLWKEKIDLFWGATQTLPLFKRKKMKTMITLYDFTYLIAKESMPFLFRSYFRLNMGRILKEADLIFPISEGTGQKLYAFYGLKHHGVIHPPLKPLPVIAELPSRYGLMPKHYILSVGTLEPRKNFLQLFQIYCDLLKRRPLETLLPLVLIGGGGWKNKKMKEEMALMVSRYPSHIKLLGYLNDQELSTLLSHAYYYVTLSLYEGYGMPLAEARRCGTPVAYFDQIEMKEAAEGDGILLREETVREQLAAIFLKQQAIVYKAPAYASNCQLASCLAQTIANTKNCQKGRP